jgi:hypothetical protein
VAPTRFARMDDRKTIMRDIATIDRLMVASLDSLTKSRLDQYRTELLERLAQLDEAIAGTPGRTDADRRN